MRFRFRYLIQLLSLVIIDIFAYYTTLVLAHFFDINFIFLFNFKHIFGTNLKPFLFSLNYMLSVKWIPLLLIVTLQIHKLYQIRYPFWEETKHLIRAVAMAVGLALLVVTIRNMYVEISRTFFIWQCGFLLFVLPFLRFYGKKLLFNIGIWKEKVLIIGSGEKSVLTIKGLENEKHLGYEVVGLLDYDLKKKYKFIEVCNKKYKIHRPPRSLNKFLNIMKIDTVFIAIDNSTPEELSKIVNEVYQLVRRVIIVPDIKGIAIFNSELHYLFMERLFMIKVNNNLNSLTNRVIKRSFDMVVSIAAFIILIPFFLLIGALIKISSPGPIFFSHKRVGRNGKEITIYKFRTMYVDAQERLKKILETDPQAKKEWEEKFKIKNDPRVTSVGKFLRRTSIDELPQIINVIKGDMSLVGPRPVLKEEIENYYKEFRHYYYSVYPGMTGLWQISGRSDTDYNFRVQTDVWYVQNWSLWLDIMILFRTVGVVLRREGAY